MALTDNDREFIELTMRNAINGALEIVSEKTKEACVERIDNHYRSCPWGLDYDKTKAKMIAFVVGAAAGGGIAGGSIVGLIFKVFVP